MKNCELKTAVEDYVFQTMRELAARFDFSVPTVLAGVAQRP